MGTRSVLPGAFRQLFHEVPPRHGVGLSTFAERRRHKSLTWTALALNCGQRHQRRCLFGLPNLSTRDSLLDKENWQPRSRIVDSDMTEVFKRAPLETAHTLALRKHRPKMCKMLVRDYIDDCLYNPHYGYFSKEAVIFSSPEPFRFSRMKNELEFDRQLQEQYLQFEDALDAEQPNEVRQLWHTPTELFKPYYGESIARYLYGSYIDWYPTYDLIVYELGAGNGTLMVNVLDWLRQNFPDVYVRTQFKIIEISPRLADRQRRAAEMAGHTDHVEIINRNFFNFSQPVMSPCFVLALEVFDNFAHDMVRYDPETERALQGWLLVDQDGEFHEIFTRELDFETARFLDLRNSVYDSAEEDLFFRKTITKSFRNYPHRRLTFDIAMERLKRSIFNRANLTAPEFLPIRMMQFFEILQNNFPHHRLIMSDFDYLPDTIAGVNAPVVQTRYNRTTVPVSNLFVQQGYFDILFPTNFQVAEKLYKQICGKSAKTTSHAEFMTEWAYLSDTRTRSGENPLVNYYANASVMCTIPNEKDQRWQNYFSGQNVGIE